MRNFQRIATGINVQPVTQALIRKPHLWNTDRLRTTFAGSPHVEADDILLRMEDVSLPSDDLDFTAHLESSPRVWKTAWIELPEIRPILGPLMMAMGAYELTRLIITRLAPGRAIRSHADTQGAYANLPDIARYHVVLQGEPGSLFHAGNETVCMRTGEIWWFNAHALHAVENNSVDDRIHLLADMRLM